MRSSNAEVSTRVWSGRVSLRVNRGAWLEDKDNGWGECVAAPGTDTNAVAGEFSLVGSLTLGLHHEGYNQCNKRTNIRYELSQLWLEEYAAKLMQINARLDNTGEDVLEQMFVKKQGIVARWGWYCTAVCCTAQARGHASNAACF